MQRSEVADDENARIKILGGGCKKCNALEDNVKVALQQLGCTESIEHVTDYAKIAAYGVMSMPALVIDGTVVSMGKILQPEEVKKLLQKQ